MNSAVVFYRLLLVVFLLAVKPAIAQYFSPEQQQRFSVLHKNAVLFYNGNRAFMENNLWGIKSEKGEIVIPAQYDSIFNGGPNHCIVVEKTGYNVLDSIGRKCFKANLSKIVLAGNTLSVTTAFKHINNYQVNRFSLLPMHSSDNEMVIFPVVPKPKETYKLPEGEFVWQKYYDMGEFVDSMYSYADKNDYTRNVLFLKNGKTVEVKPSIRYGGIKGDYYLAVNTYPRYFTSVIDLRTGDTVLQCDFHIELDEGPEKSYFRARSKGLDTSFFYDLSGKLEFIFPKSVYYEEGLLYERIPNGKQTNKYNIYDFPSLELIESEVVELDYSDMYHLFADYSKKQYHLYHKNKNIAVFPIITNEQAELAKLDVEGRFIEVLFANERKGKRKIVVLRKDGELLIESPNDEMSKSVYWHKQYNQLHYFYNESYEAIAQFPEYKFNALPEGFSFNHQLGENMFDVTENGRIYLKNLEGNNLLFSQGFTRIDRVLIDYYSVFYIIHFDDSVRLYSHEFEFLEGGENLYEMPDIYNYNRLSGFVLMSNRKGEFQVINEDGKFLLNTTYPAIYNFPEAKYFIALTASNEIEYLPYELILR